MKVYQRLILGGEVKAYNLETAVQALSDYHCPSSLNMEHELISEKRMDRLCFYGCRPCCLEEYLEMEI